MWPYPVSYQQEYPYINNPSSSSSTINDINIDINLNEMGYPTQAQQQPSSSSSSSLWTPHMTTDTHPQGQTHDESISRILSHPPWHQPQNAILPTPFDLPPPAESGLPPFMLGGKGKTKESAEVQVKGEEQYLEGVNDNDNDWKSEELEKEVMRRLWLGLGAGLNGNDQVNDVDVEKEKEALKVYISEILSLLQPFIPSPHRTQPSPPPPYLLTRFAKLSSLIHTILASLPPYVHPNLKAEFDKPFVPSRAPRKEKVEDMTPAEKEMEVIRKRRDALIAKAQAQAQAQAGAQGQSKAGQAGEVDKEKEKEKEKEKVKKNLPSSGTRVYELSPSQSQSQSQSPYSHHLPHPHHQHHQHQTQHQHHHHHHHDNNQHHHQQHNYDYGHSNRHGYEYEYPQHPPTQLQPPHQQYSPYHQQSNPMDSLGMLTEVSTLLSHTNNNNNNDGNGFQSQFSDHTTHNPYQSQTQYNGNANGNGNNNYTSMDIFNSNNNNSNGQPDTTSLMITRCHGCGCNVTTEWMRGPDGPNSLCDLCGQHYAKLLAKKDIDSKNGNQNQLLSGI
ncbi:hypothetical protein L486_07204 [Kwoniella mangroviensis CBS 10435]|uniref:GATA-type domain-containing protein n=1 Tax=Kwoniella mangroviensis CBS 10435 TaxID=1331196 RepID=A0A1B9IHY9_9TREE|nr:hypothetical protein L486_07204 [Kwoniella mangroviensis CBS 10435]